MKVLPSSPRLTWLAFHHVKTVPRVGCINYRLAIHTHADQHTPSHMIMANSVGEN